MSVLDNPIPLVLLYTNPLCANRRNQLCCADWLQFQLKVYIHLPQKASSKLSRVLSDPIFAKPEAETGCFRGVVVTTTKMLVTQFQLVYEPPLEPRQNVLGQSLG